LNLTVRTMCAFLCFLCAYVVKKSLLNGVFQLIANYLKLVQRGNKKQNDTGNYPPNC
jgi:hypothetical protein